MPAHATNVAQRLRMVVVRWRYDIAVIKVRLLAAVCAPSCGLSCSRGIILAFPPRGYADRDQGEFGVFLVVVGVLTAGGTIDAPIGRHPIDRKLMAVVEGGREAVSHYRVAERYRGHSYVKVRLETGRTHQIRVHMAHRQQPVLADPPPRGWKRKPAGSRH